MKKLIAIMVVLATIFVVMIIYKNSAINSNNNVNIQEINEIETYINKIYMWKEITDEALPCFEDINNANDKWIWEVVKKNLEDYELSYEQIEDKAKELFGHNFKKEFPKQGTEYLFYDEQNDKYYPEGRGLDEKEDSFLLNRIEKTKDGYEVEIIEYLEDYFNLISKEKDIIVIENTKEEKVVEVKSSEEDKVKEFVKNNIDKFSKKKLILYNDKTKEINKRCFVKSVQEIE